MSLRAGIGYDIHRLVEGRKLYLGGACIPHSKGLLGHSDGDVVLHAICDAMLGAACMGDIGGHFPDTDASFKDARSLELLARTREIIARKNYAVINIDCVIIAEEPRIAPFFSRIKENIEKELSLKKESVNIKATTNEGAGSLGRGEAIAAYAVATLRRKFFPCGR